MKILMTLVALMSASLTFADYDCPNKTFEQMEADLGVVAKVQTLIESENLTDLDTLQVIQFMHKKQIEILKCQAPWFQM